MTEQERSEGELWSSLLEAKFSLIRDSYQNMDSSAKGGLLRSLEKIAEDPSLTGSGRLRGIPHKADTYLNSIEDPSVREDVEKILTEPDPKKVDKIVDKYSKEQIAESLGIAYSSFRQIRLKFVRGNTGRGYGEAKFAHWLLEHGYEV